MSIHRGFASGVAVGLALGVALHVVAVAAEEPAGEGPVVEAGDGERKPIEVGTRSGGIPPVSARYLEGQGYWNNAMLGDRPQYTNQLVFEDPTGQPWVMCSAFFNCESNGQKCRFVD